MTDHPPSAGASPNLSELLARYLERQARNPSIAEPAGEVVPFEAVQTQPVDARLAWDGAVAAAKYFGTEVETHRWQSPGGWQAMLLAHEDRSAVALCLGNYPQLVRSFHVFLSTEPLSALKSAGTTPLATPSSPELVSGVTGSGPQKLLAAGLLRLARRYEDAAELLESSRSELATKWQGVWDNERAALDWERGEGAKALKSWESQTPSAPVLFNRGMAWLFDDKPAQARPLLRQAIALLPEEDGWHHLGRLYLGLAEIRG
jgi:tetratricopeptide (TPR) repeat protein